MVSYQLVIYSNSLLCNECKARDQKEVTSMNKYELAVVVSAKIEDEERAATIEKVKAYVERFGGNVTNVDEWGKKRLAYEVQKMKEAFYYFIQFEAEATAPAEIENRVRIMDNVIRFLCVRQDEA
jgi:small subunit ribosomal protein S6